MHNNKENKKKKNNKISNDMASNANVKIPFGKVDVIVVVVVFVWYSYHFETNVQLNLIW